MYQIFFAAFLKNFKFFIIGVMHLLRNYTQKNSQNNQHSKRLILLLFKGF